MIEAYKKDIDRTLLTLIALKRAAGRPRDFDAIAELRHRPHPTMMLYAS